MLAAANRTSAIGTRIIEAWCPQGGMRVDRFRCRGNAMWFHTIAARESCTGRAELAAIGIRAQPFHQSSAQSRDALGIGSIARNMVAARYQQ